MAFVLHKTIPQLSLITGNI